MDVQPGQWERLDLRQAWPTEDKGFTRWLARPENLSWLGKALGLELELVGVEHRVGSFRADIVCRNVPTGSTVVIENQLGTSDHGHLGQLLTYAGAFDSFTLVWIADRFTEEHRRALDRLNELTDHRAALFAVEVALWRLREAVSADFHVVSGPAGTATTGTRPRPHRDTRPSRRSERAQERKPGMGLSPWQQLCQDYWLDFADFVRGGQGPVQSHGPTECAWYNVALGSSTCFLYAGIEYGTINVRIEIAGGERSRYFEALQARKHEIEAELGQSLDWQAWPDRLRSRIVLARGYGEAKNRAEWPAQHAWLLRALTDLHRVFAPRVRELDEASEHRG